MEADSDEVKSAKILIEEAAHSHGSTHTSLYTVQSIPLHEEEGFTALAFALPEILQQWGGQI